jgi:hypothetical protein
MGMRRWASIMATTSGVHEPAIAQCYHEAGQPVKLTPCTLGRCVCRALEWV